MIKKDHFLSHRDICECVWHWMFPFHQELRHLDFCASRKSRCIKKPLWHGAWGASGFNYRILFSKEKPHKTMFRSNRNVWFNPCGLNPFAPHCRQTPCCLCPWTTPKRQKDGGERENKKENKRTQNSSFYFVYPFKKHSYYFQPELAAFGHGSEHTWGVLWTTKQVWIIKEEFSRKQEDELGRGQHYQPGFVMGTLPKLEACTTQLLDKNNTSLTAK